MTTFTPQTRNTTNFTDAQPHSTSFTNQARNLTRSLIIKEDGFDILTENGDGIVLEQAIIGDQWANQAIS